jgi:hypothetical protein
MSNIDWWKTRSSPFFFKKRETGKTGNRKNGKTGKREKREIFKNNFYINFINGLANQSIFIVY